MNGLRLRKLRMRVVVEFGITYTHEAAGGQLYRFDGRRRVSALEDQVKGECGWISPLVGYVPAKVRLVVYASQRAIIRRRASARVA